MRKRKSNKTNVGQPLSVRPKTFPDYAKCRVKPVFFGKYFDCLNESVILCPFRIRFGDGYSCLHPSAPEIWALSNGQK